VTNVHIRNAPDGRRVKLRTTDDTFLEALDEFKFYIPVDLREYDPSTKEWVVDCYADTELSRWVRQVERSGGRVSYSDNPEPKRRNSYRRTDWRPEPRQLSPYQQLCLVENAPIEVVRAAKKALALLYHPDRAGGDLHKMQSINNAADEIEKGRVA
jgi:hypothetical protein